MTTETVSVVVGKLDFDKSDGCSRPREFFFECPDCNRPIRITMGCGNRFDSFCPACSKKWQRKTRNRFLTGTNNMISPKFLTLTLRKDGGRMEERLLSLWAMRKRLFFYLKRAGYKIKSWCGVIEPPNHVHLIVDMDYIPKSVISETWKTITGDSFIVDIRKINAFGDPRTVYSYVTKYMSKASSWTGINLEKLKGFHLIGSLGLTVNRSRKPVCICGSDRCLERRTADFWYATGEDRVDYEMRFGKWRDPFKMDIEID